MKIGTKVKMVDCAEAEYHLGKVWITRSEVQEMCGSKVVFLEGYSGGFDVDKLKVVS